MGILRKEASPGSSVQSLRKVTGVKLITSSSSGKLRAQLGYPSSQGAIDIQLQLSLITRSAGNCLGFGLTLLYPVSRFL